jgi:hypothetical protein
LPVSDFIEMCRSNRRVIVGVALVVCAVGLVVVSRLHATDRVDRTTRLIEQLRLNPRNLVTARVRNNSNGTFDIDAGSRDGVDVNDPVLSAGSLVGWVYTAGVNSSYVDRIDGIDPITADIAGNRSETGQLSATDVPGSGGLQLVDLPPSARIIDGQTIETSGDADATTPPLHPPGIPIASVSSANHDRQAHSAISLTPLVDLDRLRTVQVVTRVRAPGKPPEIGVLPDQNYAVINQRCPARARACLLTFGDGAVFDCLRSVIYIAADDADVPPGTCHRRRTTPQAIASTGGIAPCKARMVRLIPTTPGAVRTGVTAQLFILLNRSSQTCVISGYPSLRLYGRARVPFRFGNGGYVNARPPRTLELAPGSQAYFLIEKYRCDAGVNTTATKLQVFLPGANASRASLLGSVGDAFEYCTPFRGPPGSDPGNTISVSPIDATPAAAWASS